MNQGETFFIFGAKKKDIEGDNIVYIGEKWEHKTLLSYLRNEKQFNPYETSQSHLMIPYFSDDDCFISYVHKNPLELRLEETLIPRESIVITGKKHDFEDIFINKFQYQTMDYDIFLGEEINTDYREYINNIMNFFSKILFQMLDCGYLELKNIDKVEDWVITFQEPILDLFIRYHRLETSAMDTTHTDEFLVNPKFRQTICIMMMRIISNFLVNNDYLESLDLSEFETWENKDLWYYLREKLSVIG